MNRRRLLLLLLAPPACFGPPALAGPPRNLLVELRWVESTLSGAALAGVREGAVVLGTAGSVSPKPGLALSTRRGQAVQAQNAIQRLLVLNGHAASVSLSEPQPLQWLDYAVQAEPGPTGLASARVTARSRSAWVEQTRGFTVTPHWPGGRQPVTVELKAMNPEGSGQALLFSTVQVGLDEWLTVARSGASLQRAQPGVLSSRDAEAQTSQELQLRVSLAP